MAQLIDPNDIHSAADTWSGFIYQGKVALYHVLTLIITEPDVDDLELQLDSLEDFAIIRYNGNNIIPVSLHQVKAMKSKLYSSYREAFEKLEKRKLNFPCEREAYFHLAINNENTKNQIEIDHPGLLVYEYDTDPFCKIEDLPNKINTKIQECLSKFGLVAESNNSDYVTRTSENLEQLITSQIMAVHASNHMNGGLTISEGAYYFTIPLSNFVDKITLDVNTLIFDENYYREVLKYDLNRYFQEYSLEIDEEIDEDIKIKLSNYLIYFNGLSNINFETFLQKIMPHRHVKFSTLQEYKDNSLVKEEIHTAFLIILKGIRNSDGINKIGWIDNQNKKYFPSTIMISNTAPSRQNISINIINTALDTLVEVPFNADYIITEGCNVASIIEEANKSTRINQSDIDILNSSTSSEYDKITKWKNISLIELEQAQHKLNENNN